MGGLLSTRHPSEREWEIVLNKNLQWEERVTGGTELLGTFELRRSISRAEAMLSILLPFP